jgi:hypothetical protein
MPLNFPNGLSISDLPQQLQPIAKELDDERAVLRTGVDKRKDARLGPSEVQWGIDQLRFFDAASEAPKVAELAQLFGLVATPKKVTKTWEGRASFEKLREPHAAFTAGNRIYVQDSRDTRSIPFYDPTNDAWGTVPTPFKEAGHHDLEKPCLGAVGDTLVHAGGFIYSQPVAWIFVKPAGAAGWTHAGNFSARSNAATCEAGGKLYIFGGENVKSFGYPKAVATVEAFDPTTNAVTQLPDLPEARTGAKAIAHDGKIWVAGGYKADGNYSNRVDVFDLASGQWQQNPIWLETACVAPSMWVEDGKIHVSGGESTASRNNWTSNAVHEAIDPSNGKVTNLGVLPNAPYDEAVFARSGDRLFLFGRDPTYHSAQGEQHTRELVVKEEAEPKPTGPIYNITTINDTDIGITINNVTNTSVVNHVELNEITQIQINHTEINQSLNILTFAKLGQNIGYFEGDFFLRTENGGKSLLRVDTDSEGKRYLIGQRSGGKSPAPKGAKLAIYQPGDPAQLVRFQTDKNGELRVPLPEGMKGRCYIFGLEGGEASGAAPIDIA